MNTYLIGITAILTVMYFKEDIKSIMFPDSHGNSVRGKLGGGDPLTMRIIENYNSKKKNNCGLSAHHFSL